GNAGNAGKVNPILVPGVKGFEVYLPWICSGEAPLKPSIAEGLAELKLTIRSLLRRPVFTATAAATLAVGIGANTAIFYMVHGVLLRARPYSGADRLVTVQIAGDNEYRSMSFPDLSDVRDLSTSFSSLVGIGAASYTLTGLGDPSVVQVARV